MRFGIFLGIMVPSEDKSSLASSNWEFNRADITTIS
jgi:hypothetical protein